MAMLPVVNEVNRMQTGSPVPIGGSDTARAYGETSERLGKAIFDLGNALDNEKEDKENYRLQAKIAANEYEKQMMYQAQRERVSGNMADPSGVQSSENILEAVKPIKQQLYESIDPRARIFFQDYVGQAESQHVPKFLATSVQANQEKTKTNRDQAFAGISEKARLDPSALPTYLLEAAVLVEEDTQIPDSQKDTETRARSATIVKSVSDMMKDGQQFKSAKAVLAINRQLFDQDKLDQELSDIDKRQLEAINIDYTTMKRDIEASEALLKVSRQTAVNDYTNRIAAAGNNTNMQKLIDAEVARDPRLDAESKTMLMKSKTTFAEVSDDQYQFRFVDKLIKDGDFKNAETRLERDMKGGLVSVDRGVKLQTFLREMKQQQGRDPMIRGLISQGKQEIASYGQISMTLDPITGMQKPTVDQANERAQTVFEMAIVDAMSKGRKVDTQFIDAQIERAVRTLNKTRQKPISGANPTEIDTSDKIGNKQKELAKKLLDAKSKGTLTPQMIRESKEQFRQLQQQKNKTSATERSRIQAPALPAPNTKIFDEQGK